MLGTIAEIIIIIIWYTVKWTIWLLVAILTSGIVRDAAYRLSFMIGWMLGTVVWLVYRILFGWWL